MRLYELTSDYIALMEAIDAGSIPEEAIADTLEAITGSLEEKADSIACLLKDMDAEIAAIKAEEDRLKDRRVQKQNAYVRLKEYLSDSLIRAGMTKVETARNKITFRKSEQVVCDDVAFLEWAIENRDDLLTYAKPKANLTAIKEAIKQGTEVVGVELRVNQNIQIK